MKADDQDVAILITMRLSHYCEKARWGLDRLEFPYHEESHAPLLHRIYTTRNKGATVPSAVVAFRVPCRASDTRNATGKDEGSSCGVPGTVAGKFEMRLYRHERDITIGGNLHAF